jgi:thioredoxin 1
MNRKKYITVTDANFQKEVLESSHPVLVDFWADWCGPCHIMAPAIEQLAAEYEGRAKVAKLNVDQNSRTAAQFSIRSIPTLLFFNGGNLIDQLTGVKSKKELTDRLNAVLNNED